MSIAVKIFVESPVNVPHLTFMDDCRSFWDESKNDHDGINPSALCFKLPLHQLVSASALCLKAISCSTHVLSLCLQALPSLHTSPEAISKALSVQYVSERVLTLKPWGLLHHADRLPLLWSSVEPVSPGSLWLMMPMAGWSYWQSPTLTAKQSASRVPGLTVCVCTCVCI